MRFPTILIAGGAVLGLACTAPRNDPVLARAIDGVIQPLTVENNFSGVVLAADSTGVLARRVYGQADIASGRANTVTTRFHLASLSKSITAVAVLLLVQDGQVGLQDTVGRFIRDFPGGGRIAIHDLLAHTSGLPDINRFPEYESLAVRPQTPQSLVRVIARHAQDAGRIGSYAYSNSNYNLLARIIEVVSGESYGDFVAERLFVPLGMTATAHAGSPRDAALPRPATGYVPSGVADLARAPAFDWSVKTGNGSIVSTVDDLLLFLQALADSTILNGPMLDEMLTGQAGDRVGYGWFLRKEGQERSFYINGSSPGASAYMGFHPDRGLAVVVLANHDIPLATRLGRAVEALMMDREVEAPLALAARRRPDSRTSALDYAGVYDFSWYRFTVEEADGQLVGDMGWPRYPMTLVPTGPDRFFLRFYWDEIVFVRDSNGVVAGVHWAESPDVAPRQAQ